jgi:NAD-dependent deacetylase
MKGSVMFLLGAGASVDSGMKTYRSAGAGGGQQYYIFDEENPDTNPLHVSALGDSERMRKMWEHLEPIINDRPTTYGPTYAKIKEIAARYEHCLIANQNIDGLAYLAASGHENIKALHGNLDRAWCLDCLVVHALVPNMPRCCIHCGGWLRPDIVLFGESLPPEKVESIFRFINTHKPSVCYVVGSSMRFSYLFSIIKKAKSKGAQIVHVNTDPDYKWHAYSEKWVLSGMNGEPTLVVTKKKRPETLVKELPLVYL